MLKKWLLLFCLISLTQLSAANEPPRLVVQIVVDQLRGDLLFQYLHKMGHQGFNRLLAHAIIYRNAHHPHANTTTCAGHTTLATGAYPALHGIVANEWFVRKTHLMTNCMSDSHAPLTRETPQETTKEGRSPRHIITSTISDEIMLAEKGRAFGVSFKDRGAISLAGHVGQAFWFDKDNGGFITSHYYATKLPAWVINWNHHHESKGAFSWALKRPLSDYKYAKNEKFIHKQAALNRPFPHQFHDATTKETLKSLSMTPKVDELTANFAIQLLKEEKLGQNKNKTDYLGISFSATDLIGHQFGPNSVESEDNLLTLDETLTQLLEAIDKAIGLNHTLIVLAADHGVSDGIPHLKAHHMPIHQALSINLIESTIKTTLTQQLKLSESILLAVTPPYVYLDHKQIAKQSLSKQTISRLIADNLTSTPGIYRAFPLPVIDLKKDWLTAKVNKMAYPNRTGDIYLVAPPYQHLPPEDDSHVTHGTPWNYDSYIPLIFSNPAFKASTVYRPVLSTQVAPTLAALLSINAPSGATGTPLREVLQPLIKNDAGF